LTRASARSVTDYERQVQTDKEKRRKALKVVDFVARRKASPRLEVQHHPEPPEIIYTRPIPVELRGGHRKHDHYYPFEDMRVGGSFWVPSMTGCTPGAVTKFAKKSGWRFVTRAQSEDGRKNGEVDAEKRGTRVWRTN
jgi:hypothetical protein